MSSITKEIEFYVEDVLDFIDYCSENEKKQIREHLEFKFDNRLSIEDRINELRKILKDNFNQTPTDRTMIILDLIECELR